MYKTDFLVKAGGRWLLDMQEISGGHYARWTGEPNEAVRFDDPHKAVEAARAVGGTVVAGVEPNAQV